ncbi:carbonic anhydrase 4-like [Cheilinus undulatus]|uniref:carbonic anhydrase 4-like n=1 Tax=Cheilinus undulatus TaxID=241271 RepID=UPI001BD281FB|nr:carbonic anhydrase 4-like [Cheilinus undulatus]
MKWLLAAFAVFVLVSTSHCADDSVVWCYHLDSCNYTRWPTIAPNFCNRSRQSPINIVTADATVDASLTDFTFTNYDSTTAMTIIENTGRTVKVLLADGVKVSGGGLNETYDALQFHLHWGNGTMSPGSEHTVNGKRYPMELHIVHVRESFNKNTTLAVANGTGLAALGFFIEGTSGNSTGLPEAWKNLTELLSQIQTQGKNASILAGFSLNDILVGVNRSNYWRYLGSLTTPNCNEAVVWTVFKETIKVSRDIINLFGTTVLIGNSTSEKMIDVFRGIQPAQAVTTTGSGTSSASKACYSLGLMALGLALGRH